MTSTPLVSVVFVGYRRPHLLRQTVESFLANTTLPRDQMELILSDDGSPRAMQEEMRQLPLDVFLLAESNGGIGVNTNRGLRQARGKYILQLQDDWLLTRRTEYLEHGIKALEAFDDIGLIRYTLEPRYDFSERRPLDDFTVKLLDTEQSTRQLATYLYSDHPHLKRRDFHERLGYYLEGENMVKAELDMCQRFNQTPDFHAAMIDTEGELFAHIGEEESFRTLSAKDRLVGWLNQYPLSKLAVRTYRETKQTLLEEGPQQAARELWHRGKRKLRRTIRRD